MQDTSSSRSSSPTSSKDCKMFQVGRSPFPMTVTKSCMLSALFMGGVLVGIAICKYAGWNQFLVLDVLDQHLNLHRSNDCRPDSAHRWQDNGLDAAIISKSLQYSGCPAVPVASEGLSFSKKRPCQKFLGARTCGIEWDEWVLAMAFVNQNSTVLELGARYGTTSCVLSHATGNSGTVVSVEPDSSVYEEILANRAKHRCNFHLVQGTVGDQPVVLDNSTWEYGTRTSLVGNRPEQSTAHALKNINFFDLQQTLGVQFDTLLIDCEGCIEQFLAGDVARVLAGIRTILIENDQSQLVDYDKWGGILQQHGFARVWFTRDTFDIEQEWSSMMTHAVWQRGTVEGVPVGVLPCPEYKMQMEYDADKLNCLPVQTCISEAGINYPGHDISKVSAESKDLCCAACREVSGCEVWSWDRLGHQCYLKGNKSDIHGVQESHQTGQFANTYSGYL